MRTALILCLLVALSSCDIYDTQFECPPGKGVKCASVGEVLDMIVERDEGEDLFTKDIGTALVLRQEEEAHAKACKKHKKKELILTRTGSGQLTLKEEGE